MLRQIGSTFFLVVLLKLVNAGTVDITHNKLSNYVNQVSKGYYREVWGETENLRVPATWYQDDGNKRARQDTGEKGQASWQSTYYFFADKTYKVAPDNGTISCTVMPDFTYRTEADDYGPTYVSYVGRHVLKEFGDNQVADVYAGQVLDTDGPLGTVYYVSPTNNAFMGLIRTGTIQSKLSFYEMWMETSTPTIPDSSIFDLPSECDHPDTDSFFNKWNPDGTAKQ